MDRRPLYPTERKLWTSAVLLTRVDISGAPEYCKTKAFSMVSSRSLRGAVDLRMTTLRWGEVTRGCKPESTQAHELPNKKKKTRTRTHVSSPRRPDSLSKRPLDEECLRWRRRTQASLQPERVDVDPLHCPCRREELAIVEAARIWNSRGSRNRPELPPPIVNFGLLHRSRHLDDLLALGVG